MVTVSLNARTGFVFGCAVWLTTAGCRQLLDIQGADLDEQFQSVNNDDEPGLTTGSNDDETDEGKNSDLDAGFGGTTGTPDGAALSQPMADADTAPASADAGGMEASVPETDPPVSTMMDAAPPPPPPPEQNLCVLYCLELQKNCSGDYEQFQDIAICRGVCEHLTPGEEGDEKVNTVHCRLRQAKLSRLEPFTHCKFAGPLGNDECGENCDAFCDVSMTACTPETSDERYETRGECMSDCQRLPDLKDFSTAENRGLFAGNHVQCRAFHVSAATEEPKYHCGHSLGDFPCRDE